MLGYELGVLKHPELPPGYASELDQHVRCTVENSSHWRNNACHTQIMQRVSLRASLGLVESGYARLDMDATVLLKSTTSTEGKATPSVCYVALQGWSVQA